MMSDLLAKKQPRNYDDHLDRVDEKFVVLIRNHSNAVAFVRCAVDGNQ
jgi:hypothetical protein